MALDGFAKTAFGAQWRDTHPGSHSVVEHFTAGRTNSAKRLNRWSHGRGIWPKFRHASEQNSEPQPTYEIYPIFALRISVRYLPLRVAAFEIPRKCAVFLRKMGLFLNGVQKVVSSNLTAPSITFVISTSRP